MTSPNEADKYRTRPSIFVRLNDQKLREMAWQEFHDQYAPIVAAFARRAGARPGEVDDVVEDVIAGFYEASPRFVYDALKGKFRGFLKTCTIRMLGKHVRKAKLAGRPLDGATEVDVEVDHVWNDIWEQKQLSDALEMVRKQYKDNTTFQAFKRIVLEDQSVEEVAQSLGISKESAYKAKTRIAAAVREAVEFLRREVG
jgi:RNA polymerase sigma factor (sigma-70 family)